MFAALLIALGERLAGEHGFVLFDKCSHAFNLIAVCEAQTEYARRTALGLQEAIWFASFFASSMSDS